MLLGGLLGILLAGGILYLESNPVQSENQTIALLQNAVFAFSLPGLFGAVLVSGNIHTMSMKVAAIFTVAFWVGMGWLLGAIWDWTAAPRTSN